MNGKTLREEGTWINYFFFNKRVRDSSHPISFLNSCYHNKRFLPLRLCSKGREENAIKGKGRKRRWRAIRPDLTEVVSLLQKRKIREKAEGSRGEKGRTRCRKALNLLTPKSECRQSKQPLIPSFSFRSFPLHRGFVEHALRFQRHDLCHWIRS